MKKKKATKSKSAKLRDLPAKKLNAKTAKGVKGGELSLNYGKIKYEY